MSTARTDSIAKKREIEALGTGIGGNSAFARTAEPTDPGLSTRCADGVAALAKPIRQPVVQADALRADHEQLIESELIDLVRLVFVVPGCVVDFEDGDLRKEQPEVFVDEPHGIRRYPDVRTAVRLLRDHVLRPMGVIRGNLGRRGAGKHLELGEHHTAGFQIPRQRLEYPDARLAHRNVMQTQYRVGDVIVIGRAASGIEPGREVKVGIRQLRPLARMAEHRAADVATVDGADTEFGERLHDAPDAATEIQKLEVAYVRLAGLKKMSMAEEVLREHQLRKAQRDFLLVFVVWRDRFNRALVRLAQGVVFKSLILRVLLELVHVSLLTRRTCATVGVPARESRS